MTHHADKKQHSFISFLLYWVHLPDRLPLLRWSAGMFSVCALLSVIIGLRYFSVYEFPHEPLAIVYTITAFTSHFGSIALIVWLALVAPVLLVFPFRKLIRPWTVLIIAVILTLTLLDSQLYTTNRFHFTFLTIRIFGIKTWGFGLLYLAICTVFISFCSRLLWERMKLRKSMYTVITVPIVLVLLLFTHLTHIWADATGYVPVTRFTATLPLFYPSTDKKRMRKMGFTPRTVQQPVQTDKKGSRFRYPLNQLVFSDTAQPNVLIIGIDDMRSDMLNDTCTPRCLSFAHEHGIIFANHWSGGNSTKMGLFSLFYGIPPTYQQQIESNKISPVMIDRFLEKKYSTGIFTSYRLDAPACLEATAFVRIPGLRIETKLPGAHAPARNDSAITDQWKTWLDTTTKERPFFGFLFYDALCTHATPSSYRNRIPIPPDASRRDEEFARYKNSMTYIDSLIGVILDDIEKRSLNENTIIFITADHGEEFDDNGLGIRGHGSSFSDYQLRTPLIVIWPGHTPEIRTKRTSHNDIVATIMKHGLGCRNDVSDYSSGFDLFSENEWEWLIAGSYYNFAIIEPHQVTVQFPGGYYQTRDHRYRILSKPTYSSGLASALQEMGRFYPK